MKMIEQQRQAWDEERQQWPQQGTQDIPAFHNHGSKDTTASSCDPASLSVATASSR